LGILRTLFYNSGNDKGSRRHQTFEHHFQTLR
jgi:amidase